MKIKIVYFPRISPRKPFEIFLDSGFMKVHLFSRSNVKNTTTMRSTVYLALLILIINIYRVRSDGKNLSVKQRFQFLIFDANLIFSQALYMAYTTMLWKALLLVEKVPSFLPIRIIFRLIWSTSIQFLLAAILRFNCLHKILMACPYHQI